MWSIFKYFGVDFRGVIHLLKNVRLGQPKAVPERAEVYKPYSQSVSQLFDYDSWQRCLRWFCAHVCVEGEGSNIAASLTADPLWELQILWNTMVLCTCMCWGWGSNIAASLTADSSGSCKYCEIRWFCAHVCVKGGGPTWWSTHCRQSLGAANTLEYNGLVHMYVLRLYIVSVCVCCVSDTLS